MPQNQITEPDGQDNLDWVDDLPILTEPEARFVAGIIAGKTGAQSVRDAWPERRDWQSNSIWTEATILRSKPEVRLWLRAAQKAHMCNALYTAETWNAEAQDIKLQARESGNLGAAVNMHTAQGKVSGLFVERIETPGLFDLADAMRSLSQERQLQAPVLDVTPQATDNVE